MKADGERMPTPAGSGSAAQRASTHHGRTAAAMAAATPLEEEYPVQRHAATVQRQEAAAGQRSRPAPLTSAHGRRVAQLQEWVRRGSPAGDA